MDFLIVKVVLHGECEIVKLEIQVNATNKVFTHNAFNLWECQLETFLVHSITAHGVTLALLITSIVTKWQYNAMTSWGNQGFITKEHIATSKI